MTHMECCTQCSTAFALFYSDLLTQTSSITVHFLAGSSREQYIDRGLFLMFVAKRVLQL